MARVNDVLSYAANKSNTDVRLLGETFKYVAPMAAAAGLSLDDVAAAAMTMANNGIKGSEAGVAMRAALVRMAKPTKDMRATLDRLGVNLGDFITGGRAVGADDIITGLLSSGVDASGQRKAIEAMLADKVLALKPGQLTANLVDLIAKESEGAADKDVLAETIGDILTSSGQNYDLLGFMGALRDKGVGVAEIARIMDVRQGARVLTLLLDDLEAKSREVAARSEGAAQRMADIRMKGIVGEVARLQAAWENLFVAIGDAGVLSTIGGAFDSIAQGLTKLSQISPMALEVGTYALIALTTIGPLGLLMSGFGSAVMMVVGAVGLAAGGVGKLVSLLIRLRSALSGAQAVAAGAGMAGLFGAGAAGAGALGARAASKAMLSGMGASGQMISGMSAAGAAAAAHGAAKGGGVLGKLAGLGARGMGRLFLPLGLGLMAWDAWTGYEKDGLKGAILNPLTLGMYSADTAEAAPAPGAPGAGGGEVAAAGSEAQTVVANVQSAMNQVRSIVAGVDLTAEGQRIIESLAAGMRAGLPAVQSAASQAAAAASRAALRGAFTDGGK
jgi:DNA-binding transcriptional MerR regulator